MAIVVVTLPTFEDWQVLKSAKLVLDHNYRVGDPIAYVSRSCSASHFQTLIQIQDGVR